MLYYNMLQPLSDSFYKIKKKIYMHIYSATY